MINSGTKILNPHAALNPMPTAIPSMISMIILVKVLS